MSSLFDFEEEAKTKEEKYTRKVNIPQYLPRELKPDILELCSVDKYNELIHNINSSSVSEEEKAFLRMGAARHLLFNYAKIADYYAHASEEMQELMEQSALVIIDIDDAIANGYVRLSKNLKKIMEDTGRKASEDYSNQKKVKNK